MHEIRGIPTSRIGVLREESVRSLHVGRGRGWINVRVVRHPLKGVGSVSQTPVWDP